MLNRTAMTIKARQPFINWILSLPESEHITQAEIDEDRTVYLLPDITTNNYQEELLQVYHERLFEEQLSDWYTDENAWPENRSLDTFKQWFDVEFHSVVVDLAGDQLKPAEVVAHRRET